MRRPAPIVDIDKKTGQLRSEHLKRNEWHQRTEGLREMYLRELRKAEPNTKHIALLLKKLTNAYTSLSHNR
jgi:hypothetical protein